MIAKLEAAFPHFVTLTLLVLAAIFRNPWFAGASVLSLFLVLGKEIMGQKEIKPVVAEETKRAIHDLGSRIATIEYGIKTRGF